MEMGVVWRAFQITKSALFVILIIFVSQINSGSEELFFEQTDVYVSGTDGYHTYRIPSVVVTNKGTVLSFCEAHRHHMFDAGDIDIVVTTHCHGDHIGWNISDGKPTFLNATYRIAKNDWDFYSQADNVNPQFDASIRPLKAAGNLELVDGVVELARGITTYPTHGHTPGHQCVLVESGGETAVVTGDLFHNVAQVTEQTWCPTFDWNTDKSTASRKGLLARAQSENWTVCSGHLASGKSMGKVVDESGKSVWHAI